MTAPFERLAVMGLGLLGGSVALAARERGVAETVVSVSRGPETARAALEAGLVDEASADPAEALRGADLVVLAMPVHAMAESLARASKHLADGVIVTDVGSVKALLVETLPGLLPPGAAYVGAHPMAGSHLRGMDHARADLFEGAPCILTPTPATPAPALERVRGFWSGLGARVQERDPADHDIQVGWVSHVPHALAFAFAEALGEAPEEADATRGSGFRDFTRIAWSDPELWADILTANRKAVGSSLQSVGERLASLGRLIAANDTEAVERFIATARENLARDAENARSGGDNPEIRAAQPAHPEGSNEDHS